MFSRAQQLEAEEDFYTKQDYIRERYAHELADIKRAEMIERDWYDYMDRVQAAGYTDAEEYEMYWKRLDEYSNRQQI